MSTATDPITKSTIWISRFPILSKTQKSIMQMTPRQWYPCWGGNLQDCRGALYMSKMNQCCRSRFHVTCDVYCFGRWWFSQTRVTIYSKVSYLRLSATWKPYLFVLVCLIFLGVPQSQIFSSTTPNTIKKFSQGLTHFHDIDVRCLQDLIVLPRVSRINDWTSA